MEYSLTEHGRTLNTAIGPLSRWGMDRIARERPELVEHRDAGLLPRP